MRLTVLCVGTRMPTWVDAGLQHYATRMPRECALEIRAFPVEKRPKSGAVSAQVQREGERLLAALAHNCLVIAVDERGKAWSTRQLAAYLEEWLSSGMDVAFLIGGPDGLSSACRERADYQWSVSALTLPHGLVRVIVAEQLYRAWSILRNHPYHRG